MTLRSDHIAGAAFALFGVAIIALSGDLPFGDLSFPGSGFMPKLLAGLMILFGLALVAGGRGSTSAGEIDWSDLRHAASIVAITAAGTWLYTQLGFLAAVALLLFALLVLVERKNILAAAGYSALVTLLAYGLFDKLLKSPLPIGPWGF